MTIPMRLFFAVCGCVGLAFSGCSNEIQPAADDAAKIEVTSSAFQQGRPIPQKYTGQGDDVSPPLQWTGAPANTASFTVICEDPDAAAGIFTHWVLFNLPPKTTAVPEGVAKTGALPDGSEQGQNSFNEIGYNGPMPPAGQRHRYFFKVYALDKMLGLESGADKEDVLRAIKGHVLAEGELMGTYQRQ